MSKPLTPREAADFLGVSYNTLRKMVRSNTVPHLSYPSGGGKRKIIRFDPVQLEEFKYSSGFAEQKKKLRCNTVKNQIKLVG